MAASAILDRAFGKPIQEVRTDSGNVRELLERLDALERLDRAAEVEVQVESPLGGSGAPASQQVGDSESEKNQSHPMGADVNELVGTLPQGLEESSGIVEREAAGTRTGSAVEMGEEIDAWVKKKLG